MFANSKKGLSAKQEHILNFVRKFWGERGYPPTVREIVKSCAISSTSVVAYNLNKLEQAGYIRRHGEISRGIELLFNQRSQVVYVPIIGEIAAGEPIPVPDSDNWNVSSPNLAVSRDLTRGKEGVYALKVKGNSMVDALIKDGDIVLMEYVTTAHDGDTVAIWFKNEREVSLKKFFREGNLIRLEPANIQMQPIYAEPENVEIQGKVIAVLRQLA